MKSYLQFTEFSKIHNFLANIDIQSLNLLPNLWAIQQIKNVNNESKIQDGKITTNNNCK